MDMFNYRIVKYTEYDTVFFGIRWVNNNDDGTFSIQPDDEIPAGKTVEELDAMVAKMVTAMTLPIIDAETGREIEHETKT